MKNSYLTVTDQFCGAGGNSVAVRKCSEKIGGGLEVTLAMNHWKLAIQTHAANFPEADHICTDVSACDPRRYKSTDIYVGSPECTVHSPAGGNTAKEKMYGNSQLNINGKLDYLDAEERSRATMWDVCRFAEYHRYNYMIIENVVQARKWICFDQWLKTMDVLGYNHKIVYFNSMFAWPTPQSRDRMYIHFWRKGNPEPDLEYNPLAFCEKCSKNVNAIQSWKNEKEKHGVYGKRGQYLYRCPSCTEVVNPYYYAAMNCIDWSDRGQKIVDRKNPLSKNTIRRLNVGIEKYWNEPFTIKLEHSQQVNVRSMFDFLPTQTKADSMAFCMPFVDEMNSSGKVLPIDKAISTIKAGGSSHGLLNIPFIVENKGKSDCRLINKALSTVTTSSHHGICTDDTFQSFISYYNSGSDQTSHITEPVGTLPTNDRAFITNYKKPVLEECFYRSFKPKEVKLGMGFDENYIIYGNSKDQVKQCGNAVTPSAMAWQIERAVKTFL